VVWFFVIVCIVADLMCVISTAKDSSDPSTFLRKLGDFDIPVNDASRQFATDLYSRLPQHAAAAAAARNAAQAQHREALLARARNEKMKLVKDDDDDEEDDAAAIAAAVAAASAATAAKRKHLRTKGVESGSDEERPAKQVDSKKEECAS
jgi:hypothetical protein